VVAPTSVTSDHGLERTTSPVARARW